MALKDAPETKKSGQNNKKNDLFREENAPKFELPVQRPVETPELPPLVAPVALDDLGLEDELSVLYATAKSVLEYVQRPTADNETPANQRAQVLNSCLGILEKITNLRIELNGSNKVLRMEQTLVRPLQEVDQTLADRFLKAYRENLAHG